MQAPPRGDADRRQGCGRVSALRRTAQAAGEFPPEGGPCCSQAGSRLARFCHISPRQQHPHLHASSLLRDTTDEWQPARPSPAPTLEPGGTSAPELAFAGPPLSATRGRSVGPTIRRSRKKQRGQQATRGFNADCSLFIFLASRDRRRSTRSTGCCSLPCLLGATGTLSL